MSELEVAEAPVVEKCRICGKSLSEEKAVARGLGLLCAKRLSSILDEGETLEGEGAVSNERFAVLIEELKKSEKPSADSVPEGFVLLKDMHLYCVGENSKPSWMVRAIGGDRATETPLSEKWRVVYVSGKRYISGECMTPEGLAELAAAYTRVAKPKKEKPVLAEGEEKPKRGRKKKVVETVVTGNVEVVEA